MWNWFAFTMGVLFFSPAVVRWDVTPVQRRLLSDDCGSPGFKWALLYKNTLSLYLLSERQTSVCWPRWASTKNPIHHWGLLWSFSLTVPRCMFPRFIDPFSIDRVLCPITDHSGLFPKSVFPRKVGFGWKIAPDSETNWSGTGNC